MRYKKFILAVVSVLMVVGLGQPVVGHADASSDADLASAKASMPLGLPINNYFIVPTFQNPTVLNSSKVTDPNAQGTQAVQLTGDTNQLGTIWADKNNFYFDLAKKQKASMWMYFGNGAVGKMGDGMAFVIQNAGVQATSVDKNGVPQGQETLGVWGLPDYFPTSDSAGSGDIIPKVGAQAIQKSWALEFDTFPNGGSVINSNDILSFSTFDQGTKVGKGGNDTAVNQTQHVASAYPAKTAQGATYYARSSPDSTTLWNTKLNHNGIIANAGNWLTNGSWHHLTVEYTPPATGSTKGDVSYTINDKDPVSGAVSEGQESHYELDTTQVDPGQTGKAYWGFTGSTGKYSENNLVVFEQIPGLVDADATTHIYNETATDTSDAESEVTSATPVIGGSRLRLDYKLTYNDGRMDWTPNAKINMPAGFVPKSGVITYADGSTSTVDLSQIGSDNQLNFTLEKALNKDNPTADISIYGRQNNPSDSSTSIASTTSNFSDKYGIATTTSTPYSVSRSATTFRMGWSGNSANVTTDGTKDVTVTGQFSLMGSPIPDNNTFKLQGQLNNTSITPQTISTSNVSGSPTTGYKGTFSYTVPAASLHRGANVLSLYMTSHDGYTTDDISSNITVSGPLQYGTVDPTVSYTADLTGSHMLVPRDKAWQIGVDDQRGTGSSWVLTAKMLKPLQATNIPVTTLNLVYKATADAVPQVVDSTPQVVARRTSTSDDDVFNAASQWNTDTGLLLDVSGGAAAGTYDGVIEWGLENAPS